jgi:O-antigen/teichoic acid export membrane protein
MRMTVDTDIDEISTDARDNPHFRALESRALKGTYFTVASYGISMGVRLVGSIILTRLFVPELFGLMTLLMTIIVGLNLFSHIGFQDSVIQHSRGDDESFLNTAWTIQALRGVGLWLVMVIVAWPVAHFYDQRLLWLLPFVGFGAIISGFRSPNLLSLSRHLGVARLSLLDLICQLTQYIVAIGWAFFDRSIRALVVAGLVSELVRTLLSYRIVRGGVRPRFVLEREALRSILTFGRWILIGTALTFLASQSDRLILPKLLPQSIAFQVLGVYGIAFALSDLPRQIISMFSSNVGFPFIAKFAHLPRPDFRKLVLKYRRMVLAAGAVLLTFTICVGDIFILHVYKKPYHGAAWMIAIFGLGLWHTLLYSTTSPAIMSLQKSHYNALANLLYFLALVSLLPLGYFHFGIVGAVAAVAVSDLPMYIVNVCASYREGLGMLRQDGLMTLVFVATLTLGFVIRHALGLGLPFPGIPHI